MPTCRRNKRALYAALGIDIAVRINAHYAPEDTKAMRRINSIMIVTISALGGACTPGIDLKPTPIPTAEDLKRAFQLKEDVLYSPDESFKKSPELWLGRVGVVRKTGSDCSTGGQLRWEAEYVRNGTAADPKDDPNLGYPLAARSIDPELQAQTLVTQESAAQVAALSFATGSLGSNSAAEMILTAYETQRVTPGARWEAAYADYKRSHGSLLEDRDACYVFVVTGYAHKTLITKIHTKTNADAKAGFAGVNVGGTYMSNSEGYVMSHIFALSPTVIKDATGIAGAERASRDMDVNDVKRIQLLVLQDARSHP